MMVEESVAWLAELRKALGRGGKRSGTIEHIARAYAVTLAARPLLCRLFSIFPSILEHNVSTERLVEFKRGLLVMRKQTALDFHGCVPAMPAPVFEKFIHHAVPLMIGLWPLSHPAEIAAEVTARPEMAALRYHFQHDLEEGMLMLLRALSGR
ncbi:MAG: hypothetical protein ABI887_17450 [Burkholderiales bacterium]